MNLVISVAKRMHRRIPSWSGFDVEDFIHLGFIGFLDAKKRYKPGKNCSFRTYAWKRIEGEMLDHIRMNTGNRVSSKTRKDFIRRLLDDRIEYVTNKHKSLMQLEACIELRKLSNKLEGRERKTFILTFIKGLNREEVANKLGVSNSRVSQIVTEIKDRLIKNGEER